MTEQLPSKKRTWLQQIFLSPDERRLRSGWRVGLHAILTLLLVFLFSALLSLIILALGLQDLSLGLTAADYQSPLLVLAPLAGIGLATWIARRWLDHRSFISLGFRTDQHLWRDLLFGILMPALLFALIFAFELAMGWLTFEGTALTSASLGRGIIQTLGGLAVFIVVGIQEELLSRGYQLQNLVDGLGLPLGLFVTSAIFALLHAANPGASLLSTAGILAAGYFLAYGWIRTGNLWLPIGLHIGWNFFQGTIFGFPVSGTGGFHLLQHSVNGPTVVTGGAFGPEAGLTGLAAMGLGAWLIHRYTADRQTGADLLSPTDGSAGPRSSPAQAD
ncbi:MAG: type II CAAX endopeptidase family protein [Anaerolineales bacterium]